MRKKRWGIVAAAVFVLFASLLWLLPRGGPLAYEAVFHTIRIGMTREEAEKLVPPATEEAAGVTHLASGRWEGVVGGEIQTARYDRDDASLRAPLLKDSRLVKEGAEARRWLSGREEFILLFEDGRVVEKVHCVYRAPNRVLDGFWLFVENRWPF